METKARSAWWKFTFIFLIPGICIGIVLQVVEASPLTAPLFIAAAIGLVIGYFKGRKGADGGWGGPVYKFAEANVVASRIIMATLILGPVAGLSSYFDKAERAEQHDKFSYFGKASVAERHAKELADGAAAESERALKPSQPIAAQERPQAIAALPKREAAAQSEFANFAPAGLPGFVLVDAPRYPKVLPGMPDLRQTGVWARYAASEGGARAELLVQRNGEPLSPGRKVMLGKVKGIIEADDVVTMTAVAWRSGSLSCVLWFYPASAADKGRMRKEATALATAAASWTEKVASGAFDAAATAANAAAVSAAVTSDSGREAVAKERLRVVMSYLPKIAESASLKGNELTVEIKPTWHLWPRSLREEQTRKMWKTWALANSPGDPDKSYLKITDGTGKKIGGSGMMGSSIDVDDD